MPVDEKVAALCEALRGMGSVVVAYSGGVDSTLLMKIAHDTLGDAVVALTADSPSLPRAELQEAQQIAAQVGVRHVCLLADEMDDAQYLANTPDRCYFCKGHIARMLVSYARANGFAYVIDGNNADDLNDHRPGQRAAREHGLRSPLQEVSMTKAEIRGLSRSLGLPNWDRPAAACLSSRIPYGDMITLEKLAQIERAEAALRQMGFRQLRVRCHGPIARIEVLIQDFARVMELREATVAAVREAGFAFVTLDLTGYRTGSMNELVQKQ